MNPSPGELALLDANPANTAMLDTAANVVAVNRAWRRFAVENGSNEAVGFGANYCAVCRAAADDPHAIAVHDGIRAVIDGRVDRFECEYPCDAPGVPRWFHLLVAPYEAHGERGAVVMHYDVTHPRRLAQALDRAQKMEAIGRMTSGLTHDLNNVLQILVANLRMLERSVTEPPRQQHVVASLRAAQQAEALIRRLLDFSRERGRAAVVVDVGEALRRSTPLLRHVLARRSRLAMHVPADLPAVLVDPHRLEMALLNLAINARDAMPEDGELSLSAYVADAEIASRSPGSARLSADIGVGPQERRSLPAGRYVCIDVADSGPGIPPELRDRVFDAFFTTKLEDGTGLGLAMVREFAEESGGAAALASSDCGARVVLWLPAVPR